jgi:hypothetical protein
MGIAPEKYLFSKQSQRYVKSNQLEIRVFTKKTPNFDLKIILLMSQLKGFFE